MAKRSAPEPKAPSAMQRWRAKRNIKKDARLTKRIKEGGGPIRASLDLAKRPFIDGTALEALSYVSAMSSTVAGYEAARNKSPDVRGSMITLSATLGTTAALAKGGSHYQKSKLNLKSKKFLQRIATDMPFARQVEYEIVGRYAKNPKAAEKLYQMNTTELAAVVGLLHRNRKSGPDGNYRLMKDEHSGEYKNLLRTMFHYHVGGTPTFKELHGAIKSHGFKLTNGEMLESGVLTLDGNKEHIRIPEHVSKFIPSKLEDVTATSFPQAIDLSIFNAAVVRAKQKGFSSD